MNLLIVNGTLCQEELWNDFISILQSNIKEDVEIIFVDITSNRKSVQEFVQEIGELLIEKCDEKCFVLGYSLGGIIAIELAKQFQKYLAGLILVCANHHAHTLQKQEGVKKELDVLEKEGLEAVFDTILYQAYFGANHNYKKEFDFIKKMGLSLGEKIFRNQLYTVSTRIDQSSFLSDITVPVALCYGELDVLCTKQQNIEMHTLFPNSFLFEFLGVGHMLPLLEPRKLAMTTMRFLEDTI